MTKTACTTSHKLNTRGRSTTTSGAFCLQTSDGDRGVLLEEYGGLDKYISEMSKSSTYADGVMIASAVDLFNRTLIIFQDDGVRMEFSYNGESISQPMYMGYVKASSSATKRHHCVSLFPVSTVENDKQYEFDSIVDNQLKNNLIVL